MLESVEEVKNAALETIGETAEQTNEVTKNTAEKFETRVTESLGKIDAHVLQTMGGVRAELGEWGELQQQKGKLEESIYLARVLLGILKSMEYLREVPLPLIVQL